MTTHEYTLPVEFPFLKATEQWERLPELWEMEDALSIAVDSLINHPEWERIRHFPVISQRVVLTLQVTGSVINTNSTPEEYREAITLQLCNMKFDPKTRQLAIHIRSNDDGSYFLEAPQSE